MKITDILQKELILTPLQASDKTAAITELVDLLQEHGQLTNRDQVLNAVLMREHTRSTGIGQGLAVPHGKSHGCSKLTMAIGKPSTPIDFDAVDSKPCNMIVLLASPVDQTGPHIQALAGISRLWLNEHFRTALHQANTADDIYAVIEKYQS